MVKNGIDVSSHQGKINWKLVSKEIDFAILRCGYGNNYTHQDDSMFEYNYNECKKYNIPIGVYLYSYAKNISMAISESEHVIRLLKNKSFDLPIFYDIEDKTQEKLSKNTLYKIFETFYNTLTSKGYKVGLYASKYWLTSILPTQEIRKLTNLIWVAQYSKKCTYKGKYIMWQCSSTKKISGIKGNVDYNYLYDSAFIENDYQKTDNAIYYTVKSGDNLTKIARKYNTTVKDILALNPTIKNPNLIYVNEIIKIRGGV